MSEQRFLTAAAALLQFFITQKGEKGTGFGAHGGGWFLLAHPSGLVFKP